MHAKLALKAASGFEARRFLRHRPIGDLAAIVHSIAPQPACFAALRSAIVFGRGSAALPCFHRPSVNDDESGLQASWQ